MKTKFLSTSVCILLVAAGSIYSAEQMDLDKTVDIALKNSQSIRIAEQKIIEARGIRQQAFSGYLPRLSLMTYGAQRNEIDPLLKKTMGDMKDFTAMFADKSFDFQLGLQQPIFTWGKILNANRQANLGYWMAKEEYRKTKGELILNVKKSYYGALLSRQMVSIAEEMVNVTDAHLRVTQSFYEQGKVSKYDVSKVKVQLTNAKTNLLKARNASFLALDALSNTIGKEIAADTELATEMSYEPVSTDYEAFVKEALLNRPEMVEIETQERMGRTAISLARAESKPSLVFSGYVDWIQGVDEFENLSFDINDWYRTWNARIVMNFPLFGGFSTWGKIRSAKAQLKQAILSREQLTNGIRLEIKQACFNMNQSAETIVAQKENIQTAKENLEIAGQRYKQGFLSEIEVRDAQLALSQAEIHYYQALYDYNVGIAALDKALGR